MTAVFALIASPLGKLLLKWGAAALGVLLVVVTLLSWMHRHDAAQRAIGAASVQRLIDAPVTGWAARLEACRASGEALQAGLDAQSKANATQSAHDAAALAQATTSLHSAQAATVQAQRSVGRIMAPLPVAPTCARVDEVDKRLMEAVR